MFPAQALAEEMLARGWRVRLATDARGARYAGGFPPEVERRATPAATFAQGSLADAGDRARSPSRPGWRRPGATCAASGRPAWRASAAIRRCRRWWRRAALEMPTLIHEQNGVLGRVNRRFAPKVDLVACGIWPTAVPEGTRARARRQPGARRGARPRGRHLPRAGRLADGPPRHRRQPGGGRSSPGWCRRRWGCSRPELRARLRLSQQVRPEDMDLVRAAYERMGLAAELRAFFDDVPERLAEATLVDQPGRARARSPTSA